MALFRTLLQQLYRKDNPEFQSRPEQSFFGGSRSRPEQSFFGGNRRQTAPAYWRQKKNVPNSSHFEVWMCTFLHFYIFTCFTAQVRYSWWWRVQIIFSFLTLFIPWVSFTVPWFYFMDNIWQDAGIRTRAVAICTIKTGAEFGSGTLKPEAGVGPDPEGLGSATRKKILWYVKPF